MTYTFFLCTTNVYFNHIFDGDSKEPFADCGAKAEKKELRKNGKSQFSVCCNLFDFTIGLEMFKMKNKFK